MRRVRVVLGVLVLVLGLAVTPAQAHPRHGPLGTITHLVVIYQENHSFDNLYCGLGPGSVTSGSTGAVLRVMRPAACRCGRTAARTGASTRTTPSLGDARRLSADCGTDTATKRVPTLRQPLRQPAVLDQDYSRRRAQTARRTARRLHPRHRAPLLPGAVPARRRQAGPICHRQRRRRPHPGLLRHHPAAGLRVPARGRRAELRDRRQLLPGRVRRFVPQPPVPGGRAGTAVGHQPAHGPGRQEQRAGQRGVPEQELPAVHSRIRA